MAENRERKATRRGREEEGGAHAHGGGARQRPETEPEARQRDDVRLTGGQERGSFFGRAQQRQTRGRGGQGLSGSSRHWGDVDEYGRMSGRGGGYRGGSRDWGEEQPEFGSERGEYGGREHVGRERGGREHGGRESGRDTSREYRGRSERSYGGARSMGDPEERGYEGGHRETSMGGRADYADYSNEPGWERSYGSGFGRQEERGRGSATEGRRSRWQREPLTAREIMTKDVRSATPETSIRDVAGIMRDENTGIVPVVDEERRLLGVITDRDIVMRSVPEGKDPTRLRATELMTDDVECATPNESVYDVIRMMGDNQVRRVPVVDNSDRLVGIISMADLATRADYDEALQEALEEISSKRSFWSRLFS